MIKLLLSLLVSIVVANKRVLIIGCGIGGSSIATMLPDYDVIVYETQQQCGGRVKSVNVTGIDHLIELGANILISDNLYLKGFVEKHNLTLVNREHTSLGVFNKEFVLLTSGQQLMDMAKMVYRYGLSPKYVADLAQTHLEQFLTVYPFLDSGKYFTTYQEFLEIIGFDTIHFDFKQYLLEKGINELFIDEFVAAIIAGIYNQDHREINTVAGMVSLIAVFQESYKIKEGNRQVALKNVEGRQVFNQRAATIRRKGEGKYLVNENDEYDAIVIATLLNEQTNIQFLDEDIEEKVESYKSVTYRGQDAHIYIIQGTLIKSKFNNAEELPDSVIIIDDNIPVKEISLICKGCLDELNVYQIQAQDEFEVDEYFDDAKVIEYHVWNPAYPYLKPSVIPEIQLDDNIYYLNSMEHIASCMEMEIISAKNIANLLKYKFDSQKPPNHNEL